MIKCVAVMALSVLLLAPALEAEPESVDEWQKNVEEVRDILSEYELSQWQAEIDEFSGLFSETFETDNVYELILKAAQGQVLLEPESLTKQAVGSVKTALIAKLSIVLCAIVLAVIAGISESLLDESRTDIRDIVALICKGATIMLVAAVVADMARVSEECLNRMAGFTEAASPVLCVMLTASGNAIAGSGISPLMSWLAVIMTDIMGNILLPLAIAASVMGLINGFASNVRLESLCGLIKTTLKWGMGLVFIIYMGALTITGMSVSAANGLSLRTAKFALDKLVPMLGAGGALETVFGLAHVVKNAGGVAALVITAAIAFSPILSVGTSSLALRISGAISQPMSNVVSKTLSVCADTASYFIASICGCGLMLIITLGIIAGTGSIYIS